MSEHHTKAFAKIYKTIYKLHPTQYISTPTLPTCKPDLYINIPNLVLMIMIWWIQHHNHDWVRTMPLVEGIVKVGI